MAAPGSVTGRTAEALEEISGPDQTAGCLAGGFRHLVQPDRSARKGPGTAAQPPVQPLGGRGGAYFRAVRGSARFAIGKSALEQGRTKEALGHFEAALQIPKNLGEGGSYMGGLDPLAYFHAAQTYETLGRMEEGRKNYQKIVEGEAKLALWLPFSPLTYYAAVSMQRLGDQAGGLKKLQDLLDYADQLLTAEDTIGFYTSRPVMGVFDEDPREQDRIYGNYLIGLAHKGLGHPAEARKAFEDVLALDPHHWETASELRELEDRRI